MQKGIHKIVSCILIISMLASVAPIVFAEEAITEGNSYFDFEATEYETFENSGELKIKVIRHGGNSSEVNVSFKAADFLSEYGTDYEVLDSDKNVLEKVSGEKPDASEFVYAEEQEEQSELSDNEDVSAVLDTATEKEESVEEDAVENLKDENGTEDTEEETSDAIFIEDSEDVLETAEAENMMDMDASSSEKAETASEETAAVESDEENITEDGEISEPTMPALTDIIDESQLEEIAEETESVSAEENIGETPINEDKKDKSTGSSLLDAQAAYLQLSDTDNGTGTETAVKETLDDMYNYFLSAQGAQGILHFNSGETEKEITVKIHNNDVAESDKMFMLALMGTDTEDTSIAANATTYVTICDDEEYETPLFDLVDNGLTLSASNPEGYVTVRKTGGEQYFSMVYVSTVQSTAEKNSYEEFEGKTVAFVPGETEKQVKVTAYDFSKNSKFGIRLEGGDNTALGNSYIDVLLASDNSQEESAELASSDEEATLAATLTLGQAEVTPPNQIGIDGGWKAVKTGSDGDNRAQVNGSDLYLAQYDKGKYSMLVSNKPINFTGIKNVRFSMNVGGDGSGFTTYFETDSDQTYEGYVGPQVRIDGKSGWAERNLDVSSNNTNLYLKFAAKANKAGRHNPKATIDWLKFQWAKYSFAPQNSAENFNRKLYSFSEGTPLISDIYYDGETNRVYNPGTVTIKSGSNDVSAFYGNNTTSVTIADANVAKNTQKGIYLKGVYFCKNSVTANTLYRDGKYTTSNVYYVAANSAHEVVVTPNQSFISTLISKGVLSGKNADETIKIFPVYAQEMVTVNFENTDRDDTNSESKGKYDAAHQCSYIANILEAYNAKTVQKRLHNGWLDYYSISVPKYTVIRVKTMPSSDRTANGVKWWYHYDNGVGGVKYYKAGETKFSGDNANGTIIETSDYTMADIVADKSLSMCPSTGEQTFYVGYSPKSYDYITGITDSLANAVTNTTEGDESETTNKEGAMWLKDPYIGKNYTLTALAPNGYYTSWANMSGDTNNNGTIGDRGDEGISARTSRDKSTNPMYVYGSKLNLSLDLDNTRYYYEFLPKTNEATVTQKGKIVREKTTLYKLANGVKSTEFEPVVGAYMDIAGFTGMTDGNGEYAIPMMGLPSWGTISASLYVDDMEYNATASIESATTMVLPALERFTAKSVSATYETKTNSVSKNLITVEDDDLTIKTTIASDSVIVPSGARFYIYNDQGYEVVDCAEDEDYAVSTTNAGNNYTATLTFNPKKDMAFGYKVYVQFCDQNGKWYPMIDTGYSFYAALDLGSFIFPMIGSSSLEEVITTGFVADIIGNPLGDIDLGSIDSFNIASSSYTPENIPEEDREKYTWQQNDYSYGFSKELGSGSKSWDSKQAHEEKMKEYMEAVKNGDLSGAAPEASQYNTQGKFKWSVTPSVGFNLTLSSRNDGNTYFEDLVFYVKVDFNVSAEQTIALPIGISILISGELTGNVAGIYHMFTDYQDSYETEGAVPYTSEDFGVFKKFNSDVRREGYIFLDPEIGVKLGISYGIIAVKGTADFKFDMDFQFTEIGNNAYGDVTIDLGWAIELIGFEVYSKSLYNTTEKLFNTSGQNGHIDFDYEVETAAALASAGEFLSSDGNEPLILDQPVSRDYLQNRGGWNSGGEVSLASIDTSQGTEESVLRNGTADNPYMRITKINDTEMLMVFVDDDTRRNDVNKRAVYYSIGNGDTWSEPQLIDDDGTLDDYPYVYDLGDNRVLVAWSSAEQVFEDGATVEDALKTLNIKVAFFDKTTKSFGNVEQLTKTTDEDYTADVLPKAAYDSTTDRLILYYTKTEYDDLETQSDIGTAASVTAYLFYENGVWSNDGSFYTDAELSDMQDPEYYKEQWYGQRFLDVRLDSMSSEMLRVVDTDVISYNGLSLFAWTVDWDRDLTTNDDRDVFLQIYNFSENSFTHNIKITPESGIYAMPQFGRTGSNTTYLFYGAQEAEADHGEIRYLDITDIIANGKYTKVTNGSTEYYVLQYENNADQYALSDGTVVTVPAETVTITADTAAQTDNISDYDVYVNEDGKLYLFWTDVVDSSREILTSMFNGTDTDDEAEEEPGTEVYWCEPFVLTDGGDNVYYTGIGASVIGDTIYIGSGKATYNDPSSSQLVFLKHVPYASAAVENIHLNEQYPQAGGTVEVTAEVKNNGMLPFYDPVTVTFEMNGTVLGTQTLNGIPGGHTIDLSIYADLPEDISGTTFTAYIDQENPVTVSIEQGAAFEMQDALITHFSADGYTEERYAYTANVENIGNQASGEIVFTAYTGDTAIGTATIDSIEAGETTEVDITLDIPDSAYEITDGLGVAPIRVEAVSDANVVMDFEGEAEKSFDANAIDLLGQVTDVVFDNDGKYAMTAGDEIQIQPVINGVDDQKLKVEWLSSSDGSVASIDYSNTILASEAGTTTITGILVPYEDTITFDGYGTAVTTDWRTVIPEDRLITVTAEISVTSATPEPTNTPSRGSSGSAATRPTATPSPTATPDPSATATPQETENPVTSMFDDTLNHWAKDYIDRLASDGIVNGTGERIFEPDGNITRAQFAQMLMKTGLVASGEIAVPEFTDLQTDAWYNEAIAWAVSCGVAKGMGDGTFEPETEITREQMAAMANRFITLAGISSDMESEISFTDADSISDWARADVEALARNGIIHGRDTGAFDPLANMTRAEGTVVICNILDIKEG